MEYTAYLTFLETATITVEADTPEHALQLVKRKYAHNDLNLEPEDYAEDMSLHSIELEGYAAQVVQPFPVTSICVYGRSWHDQRYNKTYQSADVLVNGVPLTTLPPSADVTQGYLGRAAQYLQSVDYVQRLRKGETLKDWCEAAEIAYTDRLSEVSSFEHL